MREILFRGKRLDNGEWVEGFLVERPDAVHIGDYSPWYISVPPKDPEDHGGLYNIICETVGQYTGLTDKKWQKIFEGDIVDMTGQWWDACGPAGHDSPIVKVEWDDDFCGFTPFANYDCDCGVYIYASGCEIIGNIHDNPELLEATE